MDIRVSLQLILSSSNPRFSERFYQNFFSHYPKVEEWFAGVDLRRQGVMLAIALQVLVEHHLHHHVVTKQYLRLLGNRHHRLGIPVSDYQEFESALLATLGQFHAEQWNEELARQWRSACTEAMQLMGEGHTDDFQVP
jgi:hemoglobin-like flavoprotein